MYLYNILIDTYILSESKLLKKKFNQKYNNWDKFIVDTCESIKNMNIFYVKAIQAASADCEHFSDNIRDYMNNFVDKIDYNSSDFDIKKIKTILETKNIKIGELPVASGTIACVFKGEDNDKLYAIKIKRNNIDDKIYKSCKEFRQIISLFNYIPYINKFNILSTFDANIHYIKEQLNFENELSNIKYVYQANLRSNIYITPNTYYEDVTSKYKNIIIMDYLDGIKLNDIPNNKKGQFCSLVSKFGLKSIFFDGFTHGDLHQGNCRFVIDKDEQDNDVEKLIVYDFGIICRIKENEKDIMYRFCKNYFLNKYKQVSTIILDEITDLNQSELILHDSEYNNILNFIEEWSKDPDGFKKVISTKDIYNISAYLAKYDIKISDWFSKIIMSFVVHESMVKALSVDKTFIEYAAELIKETEDLLN
jgi:predicted unusual protein kinase regulating ubiquinone biosynthesis (AarF/ABC1/UbiB family)